MIRYQMYIELLLVTLAGGIRDFRIPSQCRRSKTGFTGMLYFSSYVESRRIGLVEYNIKPLIGSPNPFLPFCRIHVHTYTKAGFNIGLTHLGPQQLDNI